MISLENTWSKFNSIINHIIFEDGKEEYISFHLVDRNEDTVEIEENIIMNQGDSDSKTILIHNDEILSTEELNKLLPHDNESGWFPASDFEKNNEVKKYTIHRKSNQEEKGIIFEVMKGNGQIWNYFEDSARNIISEEQTGSWMS